jgi:hypothetical protein
MSSSPGGCVLPSNIYPDNTNSNACESLGVLANNSQCAFTCAAGFVPVPAGSTGSTVTCVDGKVTVTPLTCAYSCATYTCTGTYAENASKNTETCNPGDPGSCNAKCCDKGMMRCPARCTPTHTVPMV